QIESATAIEGFHRYDIAGSDNVRLGTACSGKYNAITSTLADLLCESPVGDGTLRLRGTLDLTAQLRTYDLTIEAEEVPLNSVVRLLRQAKKQIPGDLTASGLLNAEFRATRSAPEDGGATGASPVHPGGDSRVSTARHDLLTKWTGNGSATNVHLLSSAGNAGRMRLPSARFHWLWFHGQWFHGPMVAADSQQAKHGQQEKKKTRNPLKLTCGLGRSHCP